MSSGSQLGYITLIITVLIAIWAIMAVTTNFVLTIALLGVVVIIWVSSRRDLGNKSFFKGRVAGELAVIIISKKYPGLKTIDTIEDCWMELDTRMDTLHWNDRRKLLSSRNIKGFNEWFEETSGKYQVIEPEKT